jgi:hypothetical protein
MNKLRSGIRHEDDAYDDYAESNDLHFSPGLAPTGQGYEAQPQFGLTSPGASLTRRSLGKELLRFVLCGLVIAIISAAAFASQYGDSGTIQTLKTIKKTMNGLLAELGVRPSVMTALVPLSVPNQSSAQNQSNLDEKPLLPTPDPLQRQLDTMANDVASLKRLVEQLATSQRQAATQLQAMKASNDSISERNWWLTQSATFNPPSKSQHKIARSSAIPTASDRP